MIINNIEFDAWSSGQIGSKIWACEEIEKIIVKPTTIWVLGGWYGLMSFLLLSRNIVPIKNIRSFDINPYCATVADQINKLWLINEWKFKAHTKDVNELNYSSGPDVIINTSTEHMHGNKWFEVIPEKTLVLIQSTNQLHDNHYFCVDSINELKNRYPLDLLYSGEKEFVYPNQSFKRFMIIGGK